jgi:hypothetical protein
MVRYQSWYIFYARWIQMAGKRTRAVDLLGALDEVNSSIRETMVMELEQFGSKTVPVADDCCGRDINPQLTLAFDCRLQTSGPGRYQLPSF